MIGVFALSESGSPQSESRLLEYAVSNQTKQITQQVQALRNIRSPGALRPTPQTLSEDQSLVAKLFDAVAAAKIITSQVAMHLDDEQRRRLFRQLDSLHDAEEWEHGDVPLQQASYSSFLKAMITINPQRRPGLGLSGNGHLVAAWTTGPDRLTIEFLPKDRVRWVLSMHSAEGIERYAGDSPVSRLEDGLAKHHPEHWSSSAS
jgi:hypothetical protein